MARKLLKQWIPSAATIKNTRSLKFLGVLLEDPHLFHLNRHSVSVAVFWGLFICFLPIPGQMPLAVLLAFLFRYNLPISFVMCWISNPFTMVPIFYSTYELGRMILGSPKVNFGIELSWEWLSQEFLLVWQPLMFGSVLTGLVMGLAGYLAMQAFWYWYVMRNWEQRKEDRKRRKRKI